LHRQRLEVGLRIDRVPLDDRVDVRALVRGGAGGERLRALRFLVRRLLALRVDIEIDVGAERQRDAPCGIGDPGSSSAARRNDRTASS